MSNKSAHVVLSVPFIVTLSIAFAAPPPARAADCNGNGQDDSIDVQAGVSLDQDGNGVPDECELCLAAEDHSLSAGEQSAGDRFGFSVAASDDWIAAGGPRDDTAAFDAGAVVVQRSTANGLVVDAVLTASDAAGLDHFGFAVGADGNVVAVGAPDEDDGGSSAGAVYVYRHDGSAWVEEAKPVAGDAAAGDEFGSSVQVNGNTVWVSAVGADGDAGAVYVFDFDGVAWSETARLTAADASSGDAFGTSMFASGATVFVGAPFNDEAGSNAGAVYVFSNTGGAWQQTQKLTAVDAQNADRFGAAVAAAGGSLYVGAPDDDDGGSNGGAVYVFEWTGGAWSEADKLVRHDTDPGDRFGSAVAANDEVLVVSSPGDDDAGSDSGVVHCYCRFGGQWQPVAVLSGVSTVAGDGFGSAVAVSGSRAVVGAWQNDGAGSSAGTAFTFGGVSDCDASGRFDACEVQDGTANDLNVNGMPDTCDPDCNDNGVPDDVDLANDAADDCNGNGVPDSCDIADGVSGDCNGNGVPDECEGGSDAVCGDDEEDGDGDGVLNGDDWCPETPTGKRVDEHGCARGDVAVVCHVPPGNPHNRRTIRVSPRSVPAHLRHGDFVGPCESPADFDAAIRETEEAGALGEGDDEDLDDSPGGVDPNKVTEVVGVSAESCGAGTATVMPLMMLGFVGLGQLRFSRKRSR